MDGEEDKRNGGVTMGRLRNKKGFTLLEVMITMVIFAIGLLGLAGMQVMAIKGNSFGQEMTAASTLAQNQLEEMRQNAGALANGNDTVIDKNGVTYTRTWTVTPNTPQTNMNTVRIDVVWTGPAEALRTVTIRTIIGS
jgi:type IV pilus assembly protein PilV